MTPPKLPTSPEVKFMETWNYIPESPPLVGLPTSPEVKFMETRRNRRSSVPQLFPLPPK